MNTKEIYNTFYETHIRREPTITDVRREALMKELAAIGISRENILTLEAMVGELCVAYEEQAFLDGFAAGIDHITGAVAFASRRLGE